MSEKDKKGWVSITTRLAPGMRVAFNTYAAKVGISPGNLIKNFIHTTVERQKHPTE